jgi:hypothetical protein
VTDGTVYGVMVDSSVMYAEMDDVVRTLARFAVSNDVDGVVEGATYGPVDGALVDAVYAALDGMLR